MALSISFCMLAKHLEDSVFALAPICKYYISPYDVLTSSMTLIGDKLKILDLFF